MTNFFLVTDRCWSSCVSFLVFFVVIVAQTQGSFGLSDWQIGDLSGVSSNFTNNNNGTAKIVVTYPIGNGPADTMVTVFLADCVTLITDGGITANSFFSTNNNNIHADAHADEVSVEITIEKSSLLDGNPYVNFTEADFSAGFISFCTRLELLAEEGGISVSFKKTEFIVSFDLREIGLFVVGAQIDEEDVDVVNVDDVDFLIEGGTDLVEGCICSSSSYQCDPTPPVVIPGDTAPPIHVCISSLSPDDYSITNLELDFRNPVTAAVYSPVSFGLTGPAPDFLTSIEVVNKNGEANGDGDGGAMMRVEALLVTSLFESDATTVEIEGRANLRFGSAKTTDTANGNASTFALTVEIQQQKEKGLLLNMGTTFLFVLWTIINTLFSFIQTILMAPFQLLDHSL